MKAEKVSFDYPVLFSPISGDSEIYRVDDLILEIEQDYAQDQMILHQVLRIVEKDTPYGEVRDVIQIEF